MSQFVSILLKKCVGVFNMGNQIYLSKRPNDSKLFQFFSPNGRDVLLCESYYNLEPR